jgi:hypothetical protein
MKSESAKLPARKDGRALRNLLQGLEFSAAPYFHAFFWAITTFCCARKGNIQAFEYLTTQYAPMYLLRTLNDI